MKCDNETACWYLTKPLLASYRLRCLILQKKEAQRLNLPRDQYYQGLKYRSKPRYPRLKRYNKFLDLSPLECLPFPYWRLFQLNYY